MDHSIHPKDYINNNGWQSDNNCVLLRSDDFVETDYSSFRGRV